MIVKKLLLGLLLFSAHLIASQGVADVGSQGVSQTWFPGTSDWAYYANQAQKIAASVAGCCANKAYNGFWAAAQWSWKTIVPRVISGAQNFWDSKNCLRLALICGCCGAVYKIRTLKAQIKRLDKENGQLRNQINGARMVTTGDPQ